MTRISPKPLPSHQHFTREESEPLPTDDKAVTAIGATFWLALLVVLFLLVKSASEAASGAASLGPEPFAWSEFSA